MKRTLTTIICAVLILALAGCGNAATLSPTATHTPVPPTYTPEPSPTHTPEPSPTPAPPLEASGLDDLAQADSVSIVEILNMNIFRGEHSGKQQSESRYEFVRQPNFFHILSTKSAGEAETGLLSWIGESFDGEITAELYENDEYLITTLETIYEFIRKGVQIDSEYAASWDISAFMGMTPAEYEGLPITAGYGFLEWLGPLPYAGQESFNDLACRNYTFDQTNLLSEKLPAGMVVNEASGSVCVAEAGNHLVHLELKMSGQKLYLSTPEIEVAGSEVAPLIEAGSLDYSLDVSQVNQFTGGEAPAELLSQAQTPESIAGIFSNDALVMVVKGMFGVNAWIYQVDLSVQDFTEFCITEMQNSGWNLSPEELTETDSVLTFTKLILTYFVSIEADASSGKTNITLMDMTGYSP